MRPRGALWELEDHGALRYRCRVGHGITSEGLARAQPEGVEESLWRAARALAEHAQLRRHMASRARNGGLDTLASAWGRAAEQSERRGDDIRRVLKSGLPRAEASGMRGNRPVERVAGRG
jgi:two-component system chemotaxis response regulator CheB